jgi:signal transduction histidine kinase
MVARSLASLLSIARIAEQNRNHIGNANLPRKRIIQPLVFALLTSVAYYVGTRVGFMLTPAGQPNSAFWPANAILLAVFLMTPARRWWTFFVAVVPAHILAQSQVGVPISTAMAWLLTNASEALIGAVCIVRLTEPKTVFDSVRGVSIFMLFAVLVAPLTTSFLDAAAVVFTGWGHGYVSLGAERFWTNALAELTIVPVIVLWASSGMDWIKNASVARFVEGGLLGVSVLLSTFLVFGFAPISPSTTPVFLFIPLGLLLWATARFGSGGLSLCLLTISVTAIWFVVHGREPFPAASLRQNVLSLQILLCTIVVPLMFVSAFMTEAQRTQASLRQMSSQLLQGQEQERARIGRELHDDINQRLAMLAVELEQVREAHSDIHTPLAELHREVTDISNDIQALSHDLHPSKLEYLGAVGGIASWCKEFAERRAVEISLKCDISAALPTEIGVPVFRVLQEAVNNATKHSGVKRIEVQLTEHFGEVHLVIRDLGVGFDVESAMRGKGLGLTSMRERVRLVNGSISIQSSHMQGTTIQVRVPLGQRQIFLPKVV